MRHRTLKILRYLAAGAALTTGRIALAGLEPAALLSIDPALRYDILEEDPTPLPTALARFRHQAFDALRRDLGSRQIRLDWQRNGAFAMLRASEAGTPLIPGFTRLEPNAAEAAARAFLTRYRGLFGLDASQLATLEVDRNRIIGRTRYARGVYYVSFVQRVDGVRVHRARVTFTIHPLTGDLYAVTSNVFGAPRAGRQYPVPPAAGLEAALSRLGISGRVERLMHRGGDVEAVISSPALEASADTIRLERRFLRRRPGELVPGYVAMVWTRDRGLFEVGVAAQDGVLLEATTRTAAYQYQLSGWDAYPLTEAGTVLEPALVTVGPDPAASPEGWLWAPGSDGLYRTAGDNVITFYDWAGEFNGYDWEEAMRPYTAAATGVSDPGTSAEVVTFDYRDQWQGGYAPPRDPRAYVQLSMTESFRVLNLLHDQYYQLGFTPEEGNFQGEDPVLVNAQDDADNGAWNNATMSTPADGSSPRMNAYLFIDGRGRLRDSTMDRQVLAHELGHGMSHRLVNFGDNVLSGAQSGAFGEGQSDSFAFMREPFLESAPDLYALAPYLATGRYVAVERQDLTYTVPLDRAAFSDDMTRQFDRSSAYTTDPGTDYISDQRCQRTLEHWGLYPVAQVREGASGNLMTGFHGTWSYELSPEKHSDGEIWAAALWRTRRRVATATWDVGTDDRLLGLEQTLLMGMQLMPENPTYIQARDALLTYEALTQTQPATCILEYEFSRTGMGQNAYSGADGSYGGADDYDEALEAFPDIVPDFEAWGCAPP